MQDPSLPPAVPKTGGLDATIKVLTIFKLLLQVGFYGLLLVTTVWFLLNNPLPAMLENIQAQIDTALQGQ